MHALADGELDLTKSLEMEAHLRSANHARVLRKKFRSVTLMKDSSLRFTPSQHFEKRLRPPCVAKRKEKPANAKWWRWSMAALRSRLSCWQFGPSW
jgi:anti-sigma factor RsiW